MRVRVLIADDQPLIRAGLRGIIESEPGFQVIGEASNGAEAVVAASRGDADVVLMDLRMPQMDGVEATRRICSAGTNRAAKVLVLTTFEGDGDIRAALAAGASGYLGKNVEPDTLLDALRVVARGETLLSAAALAALTAQLHQDSSSGRAPSEDSERARTQLESLTAREREIAVLVATGLSNDAIAERLVISSATVKTHVNRAMSKAGVRDRSGLVVLVHEAGWRDAGN